LQPGGHCPHLLGRADQLGQLAAFGQQNGLRIGMPGQVEQPPGGTHGLRWTLGDLLRHGVGMRIVEGQMRVLADADEGDVDGRLGDGPAHLGHHGCDVAFSVEQVVAMMRALPRAPRGLALQ
jgi:hypothetical protein